MRISNVHSSQSTKTKKTSTNQKGGGNFEHLLGAPNSSAPTNTAGGIAATTSITNVLALQEVSEETTRRQQASREGHTMLDTLERLRQFLLAGRIPVAVILELDQRLQHQRTQTDDPKLHALIDDIELRVAVEKAKLDRARRS